MQRTQEERRVALLLGPWRLKRPFDPKRGNLASVQFDKLFLALPQALKRFSLISAEEPVTRARESKSFDSYCLLLDTQVPFDHILGFFGEHNYLETLSLLADSKRPRSAGTAARFQRNGFRHGSDRGPRSWQPSVHD